MGVQRFAMVLLTAGVQPARPWRLRSDDTFASSVVSEIVPSAPSVDPTSVGLSAAALDDSSGRRRVAEDAAARRAAERRGAARREARELEAQQEEEARRVAAQAALAEAELQAAAARVAFDAADALATEAKEAALKLEAWLKWARSQNRPAQTGSRSALQSVTEQSQIERAQDVRRPAGDTGGDGPSALAAAVAVGTLRRSDPVERVHFQDDVEERVRGQQPALEHARGSQQQVMHQTVGLADGVRLDGQRALPSQDARALSVRQVGTAHAAKVSALAALQANASEAKSAWDAAAWYLSQCRTAVRELAAARKARAAARDAAAQATIAAAALPAPTQPIALELPSCSGVAAEIAREALSSSSATLSDFLLHDARKSPSAIRSMRALHAALRACPYDGKAWYRFGLLLRRTLGFLSAATLALNHSITLRPMYSGGAYAELTRLRLDLLMERPGPLGVVPNGLQPEACTAHAGNAVAIRVDDTEELHELIRRTHAHALALNRRLALRSLRSVWMHDSIVRPPRNETCLDDVLEAALAERAERRRRRKDDHTLGERMRAHRAEPRRARSGDGASRGGDQSTRAGEGAPRAPSAARADKRRCEAARALRDVLLLRGASGDEELAAAIDVALEANLEGGERSLQAQTYIDPVAGPARLTA